ncbi:MAG: AI-2E family transporter [Pseudomonadota bacterium]
MAETSSGPEGQRVRDVFSRELVESLIRVAVIMLLVVFSYRIFSPFVGLMLWALILAVALYPLQQKLSSALGGRNATSATLIVVLGLLLIGGPTVNLGSTFASDIYELYGNFESDSVKIPPPNPSVAEWPLIGERVAEIWTQAATDLPALMEQMQPQLGELAVKLLGLAASTMGSVLMFLGALIVAGIMMAYGESGSAAMGRIFSRFAGPLKGPELHGLSTATVRSVATGVIGVAFIQALLLGIGFALAGIPAAGILAVVTLLVGIVQLPAALISFPAIAYVWYAGDSTVMNIVWAVYLFVAGLADNVLKPLLLGRGIAVPMPVVLIGALGGMAGAGMVGLFLGAVLLGVGYQIFMDWVDNDPEQPPPADSAGDEREPAAGG